MNCAKALPSQIRRLISEGTWALPTHGWCKGHLQANISIVPSKVADDFERFCTLNPSACPLLYRSKPGEVSAPGLAEDSDIRKQLGKYWHIKDGKRYEELTHLSSFDWKDMVTFYLGCSFGMDDVLEATGVKLPAKNKNVSMYISNIPCNKSGPFSTNMVVSMRSVPGNLLQALYEATYLLDSSHGAPVHIGDPRDIGVRDIRKVDFGDFTAVADNEVPVFFACGVTGNKAIKSAGLPQCFSHSPGHMFICDVTTAQFQEKHPSPYKDHEPCVVQISENPKRFSVLSKTANAKITYLEELTHCDIGKRGVRHLCVKNDLLKCLLGLHQASSIGVTFGFPVTGDDGQVAEETDGMPGAISIAKALCALGKKVSFITDQRNEALLKRIIHECLELKILKSDVTVLIYDRQTDREKAAMQFLYPGKSKENPRFDHLVSIERAGPNRNGAYCSMRAKVWEEDLVSPIEDLFLQAAKDDRISTTSIGDGGNELGMGKVKEQVEKHVKLGEQIACVVPSGYLVAAGVSNWGGYAIAVGLYVLSTCPVHDRYVKRGLVRVGEDLKRKEDFLNDVEQEAKILQMLADEGVRDGITGKAEQSVDGFQFYPHHAEQIEKLQSVLNRSFSTGVVAPPMRITDTRTMDNVAVSIICRGIETVFRTANANAIAPRSPENIIICWKFHEIFPDLPRFRKKLSG